ncbi:hypothetical protein ACFW6F_12825 [Streptomyces sp. NPDC058746]|uniref:hypothetical protein n=1 Tax=Streptomyces sp. NPDC058746 TaxID=3346622 RepID=UPI0036A543E6
MVECDVERLAFRPREQPLDSQDLLLSVAMGEQLKKARHHLGSDYVDFEPVRKRYYVDYSERGKTGR